MVTYVIEHARQKGSTRRMRLGTAPKTLSGVERFDLDRLMFDQRVASRDVCFAVPFAHRRMARRRTLWNDGHKQKNSKDHEMHNALKDGRPAGAQCDHAHQQREREEHDFLCVQPQGELLSK